MTTPLQFTLSQEQYEALIALAREGAIATANPNKIRELEEWLKLIEKDNGIKRSFVLVQWEELNATLPPGTFFPTKWPPNLRASIELVTRAVSKADVVTMLGQRAKNPVTVLCTRDPAGVVGWTPLDDFFPT